MKFRLPVLPVWLRTEHPGFRSFMALFGIIFIIVQAFGNMPDSALRQSMMPLRTAFDTFGLYERGWGMFAATNSSTTVVRNELVYSNGDVKEIQFVKLAPGYALSVWNEVVQDLQFDDNNDYQGQYLSGFLRYACDKYNTDPQHNPLVSVSFQQQVSMFPIDKTAAAKGPFITRKSRQCLSK